MPAFPAGRTEGAGGRVWEKRKGGFGAFMLSRKYSAQGDEVPIKARMGAGRDVSLSYSSLSDRAELQSI